MKVEYVHGETYTCAADKSLINFRVVINTNNDFLHGTRHGRSRLIVHVECTTAPTCTTAEAVLKESGSGDKIAWVVAVVVEVFAMVSDDQ